MRHERSRTSGVRGPGKLFFHGWLLSLAFAGAMACGGDNDDNDNENAPTPSPPITAPRPTPTPAATPMPDLAWNQIRHDQQTDMVDPSCTGSRQGELMIVYADGRYRIESCRGTRVGVLEVGDFNRFDREVKDLTRLNLRNKTCRRDYFPLAPEFVDLTMDGREWRVFTADVSLGTCVLGRRTDVLEVRAWMNDLERKYGPQNGPAPTPTPSEIPAPPPPTATPGIPLPEPNTPSAG